MASNFYDRVAHTFGGYHSPARRTTDGPAGNPKGLFAEQVQKLAGPNDRVLDVGCLTRQRVLEIGRKPRHSA